MDVKFPPQVFIPGEPFIWLPDKIAGIPNGFLRSALFAPTNARRSFFRVPLFTSGDLSVIFTGFHLSQYDLDVWVGVLKIAREFYGANGVVFYSEVVIHVNQFLRSIGRGTGGGEIKLLVASLTRLQAAVVEITDGKYSYSGQLINTVRKNPDCAYKITINPELANLFGKSGWTGVDVFCRRKLNRRPLAQWLHAFYSSHSNTSKYFYSVQRIKYLMGSGDMELKGFRRHLKNALRAVASATGWTCWIDENDCVHAVKNAA